MCSDVQHHLSKSILGVVVESVSYHLVYPTLVQDYSNIQGFSTIQVSRSVTKSHMHCVGLDLATGEPIHVSRERVLRK